MTNQEVEYDPICGFLSFFFFFLFIWPHWVLVVAPGIFHWDLLLGCVGFSVVIMHRLSCSAACWI